MDPRTLGALLAAAVSALAAAALWLGNKWVERRQAARQRAERTDDLMRALLAEIEAYVYQLSHDDLEAHLAHMIGQMQAATPDRPFVPVVPREAHDTVYRALIAEIHVLPGPVVQPVVRYYNQLAVVANLALDMAGERFAGISPDRMAAMYSHFIRLKQTARHMGDDARAVLRRELGLPAVDLLAQ